MAMNGSLVAIVTAEHLEIYTQDVDPSNMHTSYRRTCQVALPYAVLDAVPTFITPTQYIDRDADAGQGAPWTIRLCLTSKHGLSVFDVTTPSKAAEAVMDTVWTLDPDHREDTRPIFGRQPRSLSWFSARWTTTWSYVGFSTAALPPPSSPPSSLFPSSISVYEFSRPESPALHYMGVRDYDETLGILVLANACGELCLYDISGRYSPNIEACLRESSFPPVGKEKLLSVVRRLVVVYGQSYRDISDVQDPVTAVSAPPYPYGEVGYSFGIGPGPRARDAALHRWQTEPLLHAPGGWTTAELYKFGDKAFPWWYFVCYVGENFPWSLERREHFLGTTTPLLHCIDLSTTIFKGGGLLFLLFNESDTLYVLKHGVDPLAVAHAVDDNRIEDYVAHRVRVVFTEPFPEGNRPLLLCEWEKFMFERNRWEEFKERGGQVDPRWLTKERLMPVIALIEGSTS